MSDDDVTMRDDNDAISSRFLVDFLDRLIDRDSRVVQRFLRMHLDGEVRICFLPFFPTNLGLSFALVRASTVSKCNQ